MSYNFIKKHLVKRIELEIKNKSATLKADNFLYFDTPVNLKSAYKANYYVNKTINRVNRSNPYMTEEIAPASWYLLSGLTLLEIYDRLKNNDFFVYRKIEGRDHKLRIKKRT